MIIQRLGSLKLAFFNLFCLIWVMGCGVVLSRIYPEDFLAMNQVVIAAWFVTAWHHAPVLAAWFGALCLTAFSLFVNVVCCTVSRQFPAALYQKQLKKWFFFILHCCFILVLACHGLLLVTGVKQGNRVAFEGDTLTFDNRYRIRVDQVVFRDDKTILTKDKNEQRALMTREFFHRKQNQVRLSLYDGERFLKRQDIYMLSPLRHGALQVTLTQFVPGPEDLKEKVGVNLMITKNYLNLLFFGVYALMIVVLGIYTLLCLAANKFDTAILWDIKP